MFRFAVLIAVFRYDDPKGFLMSNMMCIDKWQRWNRLRDFVFALAMITATLGWSTSLMADAPVSEGEAATTSEVDHELGHGGHEDESNMPPLLSFDFGSAICNLAIFLGMFAILSKFAWPVILDGLKAREQKIHGDLLAAEKANTDAKALLDDYHAQLGEASTKVQSMLAEARKDAETNGQKIIDESKAEAQRQTERAVADIETAKKVALADLAGQTSDMAMAVAGQVVGRELQAGDHAELIRQSLQRLPSDN